MLALFKLRKIFLVITYAPFHKNEGGDMILGNCY